MNMKTFIASGFGYCPLVWRLHNKKLNSQTNKLHVRTLLRIVYQDYASSFTELLDKDSLTIIHTRNIQLLAIKLCKVKIGLFMNKIFVENGEPCSIRRKTQFKKNNFSVLWN